MARKRKRPRSYRGRNIPGFPFYSYTNWRPVQFVRAERSRMRHEAKYPDRPLRDRVAIKRHIGR